MADRTLIKIRDFVGHYSYTGTFSGSRYWWRHQFLQERMILAIRKNATETLTIWDKQVSLRCCSGYPPIPAWYYIDSLSARWACGHGHHTSSALLAQEAFAITNDPNSFPETTKQFGTWQSKTPFLYKHGSLVESNHKRKYQRCSGGRYGGATMPWWVNHILRWQQPVAPCIKWGFGSQGRRAKHWVLNTQ